jgi:(E)-4-hydroxy-3-methylbut-2-enyl-diphosphate synthase
VYVDGKLSTTLRGDHIVAEFIEILNNYVGRRFAANVAETTAV